MQQVFNLFDTDCGGTIDAEELDYAMKAFGFHYKEGSAAAEAAGNSVAAGQAADQSSGPKEITLDMFTSLMKGEIHGRDPLQELQWIFAALAGPGDNSSPDSPPGEISKARLRHACKQFDLRLTEEELGLMMSAVDTDSGGTVDEEEFLAVMCHSAWF